MPSTLTDIHDGIPATHHGLRGLSLDAASVMHRAAFKGTRAAFDEVPTTEHYDLVIAGAGLSGLATALFYRERFGDDAKILIVDPMADFGGHAARNEFDVDGRSLIGYGGSESLQSPIANFGPATKQLMAMLGVDIAKFRPTTSTTRSTPISVCRAAPSSAPRGSVGTRSSPVTPPRGCRTTCPEGTSTRRASRPSSVRSRCPPSHATRCARSTRPRA
jgi:hypothetical protein